MKIGTIELGPFPLFLAPMHEVSDQPFRLICKDMGADVVITEFVSVEAVIRNIKKTHAKIQIHDTERPAGVQVFGTDPARFAEAVPLVEAYRPDFIDINAGCCARNHASRGEGAGLLRDLGRFEQIVQQTVRATRLPVTVKTRLGWDAETINILDVARMIEAAGASALTVHCRTRTQVYKGQADWSWLERIKKVLTRIPLIGNGDVVTPQNARRLFDLGCDGVMIGRGALANPWIFRQARHFLETDGLLEPPGLDERIALCRRHLSMYTTHHNRNERLHAFRKFYSGYLKGVAHGAQLRQELMALDHADDLDRCLKEFSVATSGHEKTTPPIAHPQVF